MRGPIPRKTTKPVVAPTMMSVDVPRSSAIWAIPGVNIEEAKGERTNWTCQSIIEWIFTGRKGRGRPAMKAMIPTLRYFFDLGQFLGFSSSSFEKSTICTGINCMSLHKKSPEQSITSSSLSSWPLAWPFWSSGDRSSIPPAMKSGSMYRAQGIDACTLWQSLFASLRH